MENASELSRLAIALAGFAIVCYHHRLIREAIERFKDNFPRGGPRTPMHPSPAADSALLRRRKVRS